MRPILLQYAIPSYDENNNPTRIERFYGDGNPSPSIVKNYTYDSLDRIEGGSIDGLSTPKPVAYAYSPSGNMLSAGGHFTYRYEGADPQALSSRIDSASSQTETFSYDLDGQMTGVSAPSGNETRVWDGEGRLAQVTTANSQVDLRYDASGARILKRVAGTPKQSLIGAPTTGYADLSVGDLELRGATTASGALHGFYNVTLGGLKVQVALRRDAQGLLARDSAADRTYHSDYLGSTALVTASNGQVQSPSGASAGRLEYGPYGETIVADTSADRIRARFNGKEFDETGLTYYEARYADSSLGRWTARDAVAVIGPGVYGQAANFYAFADNNPASNIDPFGLSTDDSKKEKQPPPPPPKEPNVLTRGESETSTQGNTTVTMECGSTCPNEKLDPSAPAPAPAPAPTSGGQANQGTSKWDYNGTQDLLDKATSYQEKGMLGEANTAREEATEKASKGLNNKGAAKSIHYHPTLKDIENVDPPREVNIGKQATSSAGNLRGTIRHGVTHAAQQQRGDNSRGPKAELEALTEELNHADEDGLTIGERNDLLSKIGSAVNELQHGSRWWR